MTTKPFSHAEYRYSEGAHGEHLVEFGYLVWERSKTIARASTAEDARKLVDELNALGQIAFAPERS